jgi:hypothetical protein
MRISVDASGLDALREKLVEARAALPGLLQEAAMQAGEQIVESLGEAAPKGQGEGSPPSGDADGALSESFFVQEEDSLFSPGGACSVRTTQPTKLAYVTTGTGIYGPYNTRIVPTTRFALFWPGADHPYRSVAGQKANDFVTPVVESGPDAGDVLATVAERVAEILES